jgi:ketosteroid isomerase-like protein
VVPGATDIRDAVRASYAAQREAMVAGDADALGALLAEDFTLVHMTGYRQPKGEWLADVRSRAMSYHSIEDVDVSVDLSGDTPVVTARTRTAATIWGASGTWPLQLRISFAAQDGTAWVAAGTVASTWH